MKPVRIAPNNPVFDLPVIVGIEEGLFAKAGLDVSFSASYADREKDSAELLRRVIVVEALPDSWKNYFQHRFEKLNALPQEG